MYLILSTSLIIPGFVFTNTVLTMYRLVKDYLIRLGKQYPNKEIFPTM